MVEDFDMLIMGLGQRTVTQELIKISYSLVAPRMILVQYGYCLFTGNPYLLLKG